MGRVGRNVGDFLTQPNLIGLKFFNPIRKILFRKPALCAVHRFELVLIGLNKLNYFIKKINITYHPSI